MARIADEQRPVDLLDAIIGYLVQNGVTELSLRPLGKAVGSSPRVLLYYFGSKENLIVQAVKSLRERQRAGIAKMRAARFERASDACRAIWKQMSAAESEAAFRLSLETYVLALRHPDLFGDFLTSSTENWLEFLAEDLVRRSASMKEARVYATVVIAGFRGFMLDYCASRDRQRLDRAVELWIETLDAVSKKVGGRDGK
jgi:AcrR family transcriptional regulator